MSRLTLTGAGGGGDSFDPRRITGLLFAYNLDEETTGTRSPFDSKGPDLDTVVNAPSYGDGIIDKAMTGDGTQYLKSTDSSISPLIEEIANFTYQFWYKRTDQTSSFNQFLNFGYMDPGLAVTMPSGSPPGYSGYTNMYFYIDDTSVYRLYEYASNSPRRFGWFDEERHQCIFTFDGTEGSSNDRVKFYFDGADVAGQSGLNVSFPNAPPTAMPASIVDEIDVGAGPGGAQPMSGSIDMVGFWDWTMTAADVAYEYNSGAAQAFVAE